MYVNVRTCDVRENTSKGYSFLAVKVLVAAERVLVQAVRL